MGESLLQTGYSVGEALQVVGGGSFTRCLRWGMSNAFTQVGGNWKGWCCGSRQTNGTGSVGALGHYV